MLLFSSLFVSYSLYLCPSISHGRSLVTPLPALHHCPPSRPSRPLTGQAQVLPVAGELHQDVEQHAKEVYAEIQAMEVEGSPAQASSSKDCPEVAACPPLTAAGSRSAEVARVSRLAVGYRAVSF